MHSVIPDSFAQEGFARRSSARRIVAAAATFLVVAASTGVHARPSGFDPDTESKARALFDEAERDFGRGRFEEALAGYERAFAVMPLPAFLFNMGQCARNLGRYEDARALYRRYLLLDPGAANRPVVDDLIAEMDRKLHDEKRKSALVLTSAPAHVAPSNARASVLQAQANGRGSPLVPATSSNGQVATTAEIQSLARTDEQRSILRRPWFWAAVGVVAAGTAALIIVGRDPDPRSTLVPIDCRQGSQCP